MPQTLVGMSDVHMVHVESRSLHGVWLPVQRDEMADTMGAGPPATAADSARRPTTQPIKVACFAQLQINAYICMAKPAIALCFFVTSTCNSCIVMIHSELVGDTASVLHCQAQQAMTIKLWATAVISCWDSAATPTSDIRTAELWY